MPYWLESDTFGKDPIWKVLAGGSADRRDQLQAAYARLKSAASAMKSNGYLIAADALEECRGRRTLLELLCKPVLGRAPRLHRPGDECECLGEAPWVDGYDFRMHAFLKRNPSRVEYDRNKQQKAELRDTRLKASVYTRDGGCCRYCRSGPLSPKAGRARDRRKVLAHDHVDPDAAAGPDAANFVIACGRCNEYKGRRTPYEADMVLLPVPTPAERAAWAARGLVLLDPPDHPPITDEPATDHRSDADRDDHPVSDPITDGDHDPGDESWPSVRPTNGDQEPEQGNAWSGEPPASGRVGHPPDEPGRPRPPTQPARAPDAPDIYHRRSRAPSPPPDPGYVWPPGSVPATPPAAEAQ